MHILVTGGAGYIGSHTVVELLSAGHTVTIVDNFSNSSKSALSRIEKITGAMPNLYEIDVCNYQALLGVFEAHQFDAVIHFAALKAVGESVSQPLRYYRNNLDGLLSILECMKKTLVKQIIFSSSATVYGNSEKMPLTETSQVGQGITNPYGQSKMICEHILADCTKADRDLRVTILRYFNPIGAHESGLIGENPNGVPNNLLPYVSKVASGELPELTVFGNDYPTKDGTGIRDYIHVVDLARGHLAALKHPPTPGQPSIYNLGTGQGVSVFDIIATFEKASGKKIPYVVAGRRTGDIAECYANPQKAKKELEWRAERDLRTMCTDTWRWQSNNPKGYES